MSNPLHIGRMMVRALVLAALLPIAQDLRASATEVSEEQARTLRKAMIDSEEKQRQRQAIAAMLAEYELEGRKLLDGLNENADKSMIDRQAGVLLSSGEKIMRWARFRLPQCDAYLGKALELKMKIAGISREALERDYHHDHALPQAPTECYHAKDTFVHPATVLTLTRDDPALEEETIANIRAEIMEVLGHTEVMRQLVID